LPTHTSPAALLDDGGLDTITAADAVRKPREWLIRDKIPYGYVTIWAGHPCIGKSTSLMALAASFTNRVPLPVTGEVLEPVDVLLFSKEQDESTIRGQAEAAGVDLKRLHIVRGKPVLDKNGKPTRRFDIATDVRRIEAEIRKNPRIRVLIFDPILAYVNGRLENNNPVAVRDAVDDLVELAKERRLAAILVSHLTKIAPLGKVPAWTQIAGSGAWTALCRAAFLVREDENNPGRILILNAKPSLTGNKSGYAYRIEKHVFADGDDVGKAVFEAVRVEENADQVVNGQKPVNNVEFVKAQSLILDVLAKEGKISRSRLLMLAAEADISESTLGRALSNTPLIKEKDGVAVEYSLPKSKGEAAREALGRIVPVPRLQ
jgi:hypothetical protein